MDSDKFASARSHKRGPWFATRGLSADVGSMLSIGPSKKDAEVFIQPGTYGTDQPAVD